ncbi:hypothetical protein [Nocardia asteroides]|uniref:hypothetical protein n=1 Tax=Nocardia asteroides TaxID=1824 RepID=UPI001E4B29BF|nr:hypothetical protein [Nocardia asteroides]UGT60668.1 hypothetical protein LTT61_26420 [Nocardia asteroides]
MAEGPWWRRLFGSARAVPLDPARPDLVVVAASFDDAEAASTALERADRFVPGDEVVLRHHLRVPAEHVERVCELAGQDGYARAESGDPGLLLLQRVQVLDALHCSQERSRMAGLAQRHDGVAAGWEALQPG